MGLISRLGAVVQARDMYEQKVHLMVAGRSSIKTHFGGFVSILVYSLIIVFTITRLYKLVKRDDPFIYEVKQQIDLADEETPLFNF
jgi:hypothetical protein